MELLEKHFDTAFAAPDGIKKLRELILTLAMQGKLVPQDPDDQPASELLKEIEGEKRRLVKSSTIKEPKSFSEIKPEEVQYALPEGWKWVRLACLCTLINGDRGKNYPSKEAYVISGIPFINAGHLVNGLVDLSEMNFIPENRFELLGSGKVRENDILYCLRGSLGKTAVVKGIDRGAIASSLVIVRLYKTGMVSFLYRYLVSPFAQRLITKYDNGSAQPNLSANSITQYVVPLPPIAEQHRIIAKINQLMARCDELEKLRAEREQKRLAVNNAALSRLLTTLESNDFNTAWPFITQHFGELYSDKASVAELRKAVLKLAVMGKLVPQDPNDQPASELLKEIEAEKKRLVKEGKIKAQKPLPEISPEDAPYVLPGGWEWVRIIDLVEVGTGSTPATSNRDYYDGNIPWYTSSATNKPIADNPETFITEKAIKDTNCKIFPSGSLIIALYGQGKTRGQISEIATPGATNQAIAAMVFYESSKEIKGYLKHFFVKIYEEIRSLAEGAAQPNLNVGKIKEALVPLPPLAEQHRIVAKIDQLMALCDAIEMQIDAANGKRTALLNAVMALV